mmetsp:Transcript_28630/g.41799  ORF Transcript_28630/g.41799 Transcript_28630/m.41799 type:complete len:264 (+) Transcript_28630:509-1300(+)
MVSEVRFKAEGAVVEACGFFLGTDIVELLVASPTSVPFFRRCRAIARTSAAVRGITMPLSCWSSLPLSAFVDEIFPFILESTPLVIDVSWLSFRARFRDFVILPSLAFVGGSLRWSCASSSLLFGDVDTSRARLDAIVGLIFSRSTSSLPFFPSLLSESDDESPHRASLSTQPCFLISSGFVNALILAFSTFPPLLFPSFPALPFCSFLVTFFDCAGLCSGSGGWDTSTTTSLPLPCPPISSPSSLSEPNMSLKSSSSLCFDV